MNRANAIAEIVAHASNLREHSDYDEAVKVIREGMLAYPNDCWLLTTLGILQDAQGNVENAILTFQQAVQLMPSNSQAHYNLGSALSSQGLTQASITEFRIAISLDPSDPDMHQRLGCELADRNLFSEALSEYEAAIRLRPNSVGPYMNKALILYDLAERAKTRDRLRKWKQAKEAFLAAIMISPSDAEAYYGLGVSELQLKHFTASIRALETAISLSPEKQPFYLALGKAQLYSLQWRAAWNTAQVFCKKRTKSEI